MCSGLYLLREVVQLVVQVRSDAVVFSDQSNGGTQLLSGQPQAVGQRCCQCPLLIPLSYFTETEWVVKKPDTLLQQTGELSQHGDVTNTKCDFKKLACLLRSSTVSFEVVFATVSHKPQTQHTLKPHPHM